LMTTVAIGGWFTVLASVGTVLTKGYVSGDRLAVLGINENALGIAVLATLPGVLWLAANAESHRKARRVLFGLVFLLLAICVTAMSGSRGSIISFLVTLLVLVFWKTTRLWGVLGLLFLAFGAAFSPFLFSTTLERFAIVRGDTLLGGREAIWQAAVGFILDHPWGGAGIGNASYEIMPYLRQLRSTLGYARSSIHNPVLAVWADTGILGILLYLGTIISALWSFARQYHRYRESGLRFLTPYFALVSSVFLGYMASWIKGGGIEASFIHFLMLALLLVPARLESNGETKRFEL